MIFVKKEDLNLNEYNWIMIKRYDAPCKQPFMRLYLLCTFYTVGNNNIGAPKMPNIIFLCDKILNISNIAITKLDVSLDCPAL